MATYFVAQKPLNANAPPPSDNNAGTEFEPWKTIGRAVVAAEDLPQGAVTVQLGDTVYVKEGTYTEKVRVKVSGEDSKYITLAAYPPDKGKVILSGAEVLPSLWQQPDPAQPVYRAVGWKYEFPAEDTEILYQSKQKLLGKWPTWEAGLPGTLLGMGVFDNEPDIKAIDADPTLTKEEKYQKKLEKAQQIVAQWLEQDLNEKQVFLDGVTRLGQVFSLTDMAKGTFFVDPATHELYVWLKDDSNPANHVIEAAKNPYLFIAKSVHHVKIQGFVMHKAASLLGMHLDYDYTKPPSQLYGALHAVLLQNCEHMILEENTIEWMSAVGLVVSDKKDYTLVNNKVNNNGHIGLSLGPTTHVLLKGNETSYNGWRWERLFKDYPGVAGWSNGGIHGGGKKMLALNHRSKENWGHGLWFDNSSGENKILDGEFSNNKGPSRVGIRLEATPSTEVARNRLFENVGGGISISGGETYPANDCWVHHNLVIGKPKQVGGTGIGVLGGALMDEPLNGTKVHNNTIVDLYIGVAVYTTGTDTEIMNNIIARCSYEGLSFSHTKYPFLTIVAHNDFFENKDPSNNERDVVWHQGDQLETVWVYPSNWPSYPTWINNIKADPMFIDEDGFELKCNSPCINGGVHVSLPFYGRNPDIGAYEADAPPLRLSIMKNGPDVLVYATVEGCDVYLLRRIVVCTEAPEWTHCRYFRPGGFFDFEVGGEQIEPNIVILKARMPAPAGPFEAFADGHYLRVDQRAITPKVEF